MYGDQNKASCYSLLITDMRMRSVSSFVSSRVALGGASFPISTSVIIQIIRSTLYWSCCVSFI